MKRYLQTDTLNEAIKSLEFFVALVPKIDKDKYLWKWALISLHNSVQNFMVCVLWGTNYANVCRSNPKYHLGKLEYFIQLYKGIKSNRMLQYTESKIFIPKTNEDTYMELLNELRNDFIHYIPKSTNREISEWPELCLSALSIIDFTVNASGNFPIYRCANGIKDKQRINKVLNLGKKRVAELRIAYKR